MPEALRSSERALRLSSGVHAERWRAFMQMACRSLEILALVLYFSWQAVRFFQQLFSLFRLYLSPQEMFPASVFQIEEYQERRYLIFRPDHLIHG